MFCGTVVFVVILGILISTSTSSAAPLHEDFLVNDAVRHDGRSAEVKEREASLEKIFSNSFDFKSYLDPDNPAVQQDANTTTSDKENENEHEHEVEPTGEKRAKKEASENNVMHTPEEQNHKHWAQNEGRRLPRIEEEILNRGTTVTGRVSDFLEILKRQQEKKESKEYAERKSAVEVSRLQALLKSFRTERFGTMITHPRANVYGLIENEGGAFYYNLRGELNPGCMALDGTNLSVTSIDTLYTCVRLFSSPDCKGETRAYYPGNSELPILPNARSIGPCFDNELDETSSKYVQHGMVLVKEFTKLETSPGSNQFTTPDVQNIL